MNLSGDDSSNDGSPVPAKRLRTDTSSTTSPGSAPPDSDDEQSESTNVEPYTQRISNIKANKLERTNDNLRLSINSLNENCSSPNDDIDNYKPGFAGYDNGETAQTSFKGSNDTFYNKADDEHKNLDGELDVGYSDISKRIMSKMGYKKGKGLGVQEDGRVEPVEASTQKGRRGLGLKPSVVGQVPADFKWSPDDSKPDAVEKVLWMPLPPDETLLGYLLEDWLKIGEKKLTIDDEIAFVEKNILDGVLDSKTIFDNLDDPDLRKARYRSNPYETIGASIFLNRAAVKMANIDYVFDFNFSQPKQPNGVPAIKKDEILYFADVCAGPGGFSEYILYRTGWRAKGFGFTLKGPCDFKLTDFYAGTSETFNPYYGIKDDGNIFDPENLTSLKQYVLTQTDDKGVHFLMADGGFSVEGQENIQEILSKQLYLCQCLAALMLVRTGGNFVVKLFDIFTLFSVGLIYIMYRCFDKVCIHKPVTSRPANSERYLVCMGKKIGTEAAENHLYSVNSMLWKGIDNDKDVTELVPLQVMQEDAEFYEYIYKSNCIFGEKQIKNLLKIAAFSKDKNLTEPSQKTMREECLKLWKLPNTPRTQPEQLNPDETLQRIFSMMSRPPPDSHNIHSFKSSVLNKPPEYLDNKEKMSTLKNIYDWHLTFLSSGKKSPHLTFFIGCGGNKVFFLDGTRWKFLEAQITIPPKTLLYGEILNEFKGEGTKQQRSKALHVIDALMLGGTDISYLTLTYRMNDCRLFCSALSKPYIPQIVPLMCKRLFDFDNFTMAMQYLEFRNTKQCRRAVTIDSPNRNNRDEKYYVVGSVLFLKEIKEPWMAQKTRTDGRKYCYRVDPVSKKVYSEHNIPNGAQLDMLSTFARRLQWVWEDAAAAIVDGLTHSGITCADLGAFVTHYKNNR